MMAMLSLHRSQRPSIQIDASGLIVLIINVETTEHFLKCRFMTDDYRNNTVAFNLMSH